MPPTTGFRTTKGLGPGEALPSSPIIPNKDLSPQALLARGYSPHTAPPMRPVDGCAAPTGTITSPDSRQYVCGLPCPPQERVRCPHGPEGSHSYVHGCIFTDSPRLIGPIRRERRPGRSSTRRKASERTNSYNQEVIDHGPPPKSGGLRPFGSSGAIA